MAMMPGPILSGGGGDGGDAMDVMGPSIHQLQQQPRQQQLDPAGRGDGRSSNHGGGAGGGGGGGNGEDKTPGAAWNNKKAHEEYVRAMESILDDKSNMSG